MRLAPSEDEENRIPQQAGVGDVPEELRTLALQAPNFAYPIEPNRWIGGAVVRRTTCLDQDEEPGDYKTSQIETWPFSCWRFF